MSDKKKEVEIDPNAEAWLEAETDRFNAEVEALAQANADQEEAEDRARWEAEEEERQMMEDRFSNGPQEDEES